MRRRRTSIELPNGLGWCTVTAVSPALRVQVDGATSDSPVNVNATGSTPQVNDRLMWTGVGKQLVLIGDPRPVGEIIQMAGGSGTGSNVAPNSNWILCNGGSITVGTWPKLDAYMKATGYPYGSSGSPVASYNLPPFHDGNGRFARGAGSGGSGGGDPTTHTHGVPTHTHGHSHAHGTTQIYAAISVNSVGQVTVRDVSDVPGDVSASWTETRRLNLGSSTWGGSVSSGRSVGAEVRGATDGPGTVNTDTGTSGKDTNQGGQFPWYVGVVYFIKAA